MGTDKAPSFQWYPKDCDTDEKVKMMDDREYGFYARCLNHSWINDGLPGELSDISRVTGRTLKYVRTVWLRVGDCFPLYEDGRRRNPRQESQRKASEKFKAERSESGKNGAHNRWHKNGSANGSAIKEPMANDSFASASASSSASANTPQTPQAPGGAVTLFGEEISATPEAWKVAVKTTAKNIHARHPVFRKCALEKVEEKLTTITKALPLQERISCLEYIDSQHRLHCESVDWTKNGGEFVKGLEPFLNPRTRMWENTPRATTESEDNW